MRNGGDAPASVPGPRGVQVPVPEWRDAAAGRAGTSCRDIRCGIAGRLGAEGVAPVERIDAAPAGRPRSWRVPRDGRQ